MKVTIEYDLDGKRPGYKFGQTGGLTDALLKEVWRHAMPRGQGWGAEIYVGARSLKSFWLDGRAALSEVVVTDQQDEAGRRGLRRAEINIFPAAEMSGVLHRHLSAYPEILRQEASRRLTLGTWKHILDGALPKLAQHPAQVILSYPFSGSEAWQLVEVLTLQLVNSWLLRAIPGWGPASSFTTLALTPLDESRLVALPMDRARRVVNAPVTPIPA
jgi:hypothetical protein